MRATKLRQNLILSLAAGCLTLLLCEAVLRLAAGHSEECYGTLIGTDLPPCSLRSPYHDPGDTDRSAPYPGLVVDGRQITFGDLWGIARHDPVLGYSAQEEAVSVNGWWRTDRRGARVSAEPPANDAAPATRILVLGDSFAVGSRLPYEEAWPYLLDARHADVTVDNFAMDGFSMAQAYLRYLTVHDEVEHDLVILMFVPEEDLWRDVNVRRDVAARWAIYWVMPKFELDGEALRLVETPFADQGMPGAVPPPDVDRRLRAHLRAHDPFYFDDWYETPPVVGRLLVYKLAAAVRQQYRFRRLYSELRKPDSEALRTAAALFRAASAEVASSGRQLVLAVLPTERGLLRADEGFWRRWDRMTEAVCAGVRCIDLGEELRRLPVQDIDRGHDGSHFGPRVNDEIARILAERLLSPGEARAQKSAP